MKVQTLLLAVPFRLDITGVGLVEQELESMRKPSVAEAYPHLVAQLHPDSIFDLRDFTCGSTKELEWICPNNPLHESWPAQIKSRTSGQGCPSCSGNRKDSTNNLPATRPDLAAQWHPDNIMSVTDASHGMKNKVMWQCPHCQFEWGPTRIRERTAPYRCRNCRKVPLTEIASKPEVVQPKPQPVSPNPPIVAKLTLTKTICKIWNAFAHDETLCVSDLAVRTGLPRSTVKHDIGKLIERGVLLRLEMDPVHFERICTELTFMNEISKATGVFAGKASV